KWFAKSGRTHPNRQKPLQFLNRFLSSIKISSKGRIASKRIYEDVLDFLSPFGLPSLQPVRKEIIRIAAAESRAKYDPGMIKRLKALAGTYQIIRPSSAGVSDQAKSRVTRYVLEAMAIEVDEDRHLANLLMYSRGQPDAKFVYTRPLYLAYRYGYSLAHRVHE